MSKSLHQLYDEWISKQNKEIEEALSYAVEEAAYKTLEGCLKNISYHFDLGYYY